MKSKLAAMGLLFSALVLAGCASVVWERPGTPPQVAAMDSARCQLMAESLNPERASGNYSDRLLQAAISPFDALADIGSGVAQGMAINHAFDLCMQENGYVAVAPGAPSPVMPMAAQPYGPVALVPSAVPPPLLPPSASAPMAAVLPPIPPSPCGNDDHPCWTQTSLVGIY